MNNDYSKEDLTVFNNNNFQSTINNEREHDIIAPSVTMNRLNSVFQIFNNANYLDLCNKFDSMTETEQKLFILYSFFHLELIFNQEDIGLIFTDEVLKKMDSLTNEFKNYGSDDTCSLRCIYNMYGPALLGSGKDISIPVEIEKVVNCLDLISIEELATVACKSTYYKNSEERMFKDINDPFQKELAAFMNIAYTYTKSKTA